MSAHHTKFVYKLVPTSSPVPDILPERLPVSDIDEKSGFIHLSTAEQIMGTLKSFFAKDAEVYILRLPLAKIEGDIRWEAPEMDVCGPRDGEGTFPHLYNGMNLGRNEIDSMERWEQTGGKWDDVVNDAKARGWLA